jgi:hypothetical protein
LLKSLSTATTLSNTKLPVSRGGVLPRSKIGSTSAMTGSAVVRPSATGSTPPPAAKPGDATSSS